MVKVAKKSNKRKLNQKKYKLRENQGYGKWGRRKRLNFKPKKI